MKVFLPLTHLHLSVEGNRRDPLGFAQGLGLCLEFCRYWGMASCVLVQGSPLGQEALGWRHRQRFGKQGGALSSAGVVLPVEGRS